MEIYGKFLMKTPTKVIVVLVYFGLVVIGIYESTNVKIGFDPKIVGDKNSDFVSYMNVIETNFPSGSFAVSVVSQGPVDYSLHRTQQQFRMLDDITKESKYFKDVTYNCIRDFLRWAERFNKNHTGIDFYQAFREFLYTNQRYTPDLKFSTSYSEFINNGDGHLIACKVTIFSQKDPSLTFQLNSMNDIRSKLKVLKEKTGYLFIPVCFRWVPLEILEVIGKVTGTNLAITSAVTMIITLPYVINPIISILMGFMFGSMSVLLVALMTAWDIELNGIPSTIIIVSVGFCVDYMAHVAHAYVHAEGETPEERMIYSLKTMGRSVTKGVKIFHSDFFIIY